MSPQEVFEKLRDIHLPEVEAKATGYIEPWPLLVFIGLLVAILAFRYWQRRRNLGRALAAIDHRAGPADQRDQILRLIKGYAADKRQGAAPDGAYLPPARLSDTHIKELRRWAKAGFR